MSFYRRFGVFCLMVLFLSGVAACSHLQRGEKTPITQGKNDHREYRYVLLDNGLKVLLISDAKADLASVSMHVGVGSGHDPLERQGLTHFLEHMLFLGTEKFPQADGFQQFISKSGGQHNAYTALDHTNYFFTVAPKALPEALDRFSQFFISPLLDPQYVEQEKHAVHSEFQAGLQNDFRRQRDVLSQFMHQEHPLAKFSVGSLVTLNNSENTLVNDLKALFDQYYYAENMSLSVLSPLSLDELEDHIKQDFIALSGKPSKTKAKWAENPFATQLPQKIRIQPVKQLHELTVLFPMPTVRHDGKKSLSLLAHLLGDEGENSLHHYLKQLGLVDTLSAGMAWKYDGGSAFAVHFGLTEKGQSETQLIIEQLFATIMLIQQQSADLQLNYDDVAQIERLSFDYQAPSDPLPAVIAAANNLQHYAPEQVLFGDHYYAGFDQQDFKMLLTHLHIDNALIVELGELEGEKQFSHYYQAPYQQEYLSDEWLSSLRQVKASDVVQLTPKNPFIANNLKLLKRDKKAVPQQIVAEPQGELWHKGLSDFTLPRASVYYSFILPEEKLQEQQAVLLSLYIALLKDNLNAWLYPAQVADLDFGLYSHLRGFTVRVQGFSEQQQALLTILLEQLGNTQFSQEQFERVQQKLLRSWKNSEKNPPYQRFSTQLNELLLQPSVSLERKQQYLAEASLEQLQDFAAGVFNGAYLRVLANGNITEKQANHYYQQLKSVLVSKETKPADIQVVALTENAEYHMQSQHGDALLALYWQAQGANIEEQARWMLLAQALESPFFHTMRTEKQLGYVVFARYYPLWDRPGMAFVIQSPAADEAELYALVKGWQQQQLKSLANSQQEQLDEWKQAVLQQIMQSDKSLEEQTARYWHQLALSYSEFDQYLQLQKVLQDLTLEQWQQFIEQFAAPSLLISTSERCIEQVECAQNVGNH